MRLLLLGVVEDDALDSSLAHLAELRCHVVAHTTDYCRTIHPLGHISATLIHADGVVVLTLLGGLRWDLHTLGHHILPLRLEIYHRGDILLPGLIAKLVSSVGMVGVLVEILVGQSSERVAKFVHYDGLEHRVVSRR